MKLLVFIISISFIFIPVDSYGQQLPAKVAVYDESETLLELEIVKNNLAKTNVKIIRLEKILESNKPNEYISWLGFIAAFIAACIAAAVALRNQNEQSKQNRLLKSIEIIMSSANGYQASTRVKNLDVFLDEESRKHFSSIDEQFSGMEYTELAVNLAQSMSDKADTPEEVLNIWKSVVNKKHAVHSVKYKKIQQVA